MSSVSTAGDASGDASIGGEHVKSVLPDATRLRAHPDGLGENSHLVDHLRLYGTPPDVKETFRASTRYAWILVQMATASPEEYPTVHALQDQLKLTPLNSWGKPYAPPDNVPIDPWTSPRRPLIRSG